jgi:hypothetical protein
MESLKDKATYWAERIARTAKGIIRHSESIKGHSSATPSAPMVQEVSGAMSDPFYKSKQGHTRTYTERYMRRLRHQSRMRNAA